MVRAGSGLAHNDDVRLLNLHLVGGTAVGGVAEAFVVVVDRHRQSALGILLPYHILVEMSLYLRRRRYGAVNVEGVGPAFAGMKMLFQQDARLLDTRVANAGASHAGEKHGGLRLGTATE